MKMKQFVVRVSFLTLVVGAVLPYKSAGGGYRSEDKIRHSGLIAIKNLFETQDAIRDQQDEINAQLQELKERESEVKKKQEKIKLVAKGFQGLFPNGRNTERQTRNLLRNLGDIKPVREKKYEEKKVVIHKKSSGVTKGIIIGGLVAVAGVAIALILGGRSSGSTSSSNCDANFAKFIKDYVSKH